MIKKIKTVGELIDALSVFNCETPIESTYDNLRGPLLVYQAADGTVLMDADGGLYQADHQELRCNKPAEHILPKGARCYHCWEK